MLNLVEGKRNKISAMRIALWGMVTESGHLKGFHVLVFHR